jgi:hypothetical protein
MIQEKFRTGKYKILLDNEKVREHIPHYLPDRIRPTAVIVTARR